MLLNVTMPEASLKNCYLGLWRQMNVGRPAALFWVSMQIKYDKVAFLH